jgi:hypothetical protein
MTLSSPRVNMPLPEARGAKMSDGKERRAQIDTETVRALLLINGGGAVSLGRELINTLADGLPESALEP